MEEWRDVVGYEGIYEVSNKGRVRTKEGKTTYTEMHGTRVWKQRILKQKVSKDNNHRVSLWKDGKERTWLVHRLVAFAFIPETEGKEYVNHINGDRYNNSVENLEWCNHVENNNHAFDTGLIKTAFPVSIKNKESGEVHNFRSMVHGSYFLGRSHNYISNLKNKLGSNTIELEDYLITVETL